MSHYSTVSLLAKLDSRKKRSDSQKIVFRWVSTIRPSSRAVDPNSNGTIDSFRYNSLRRVNQPDTDETNRSGQVATGLSEHIGHCSSSSPCFHSSCYVTPVATNMNLSGSITSIVPGTSSTLVPSSALLCSKTRALSEYRSR